MLSKIFSVSAHVFAMLIEQYRIQYQFNNNKTAASIISEKKYTACLCFSKEKGEIAFQGEN